MANKMFLIFLPFIAILSPTLQASRAVEYTVTNNAAATPGGIRFTNEVGVEYTKHTLRSATDFIWKLFKQNSDKDKKQIARVIIFIEQGTTYYSDNEIHFSAEDIADFAGDIRTAMTGDIYHTITHIWQWEGTSLAPAPGGLLQGIADFVRLKAGYENGRWVKPGEGDRWDQGYDVTARFLDYCDGLRGGFVAELNKKMRNGYSPNYFVELLGKTADQLWVEYKAHKYTTKLILYCET